MKDVLLLTFVDITEPEWLEGIIQAARIYKDRSNLRVCLRDDIPMKVRIRLQFNDWKIGKVDFSSLSRFKWDYISGGVQSFAP
jgi:hypothetical protein